MSLEHSRSRAEDAPAGHPKKGSRNQAPPAIDRIVGESECRPITNLRRTTRWRLMRQNELPRKVRLSQNRTGWTLRALLNWLTQREAAL